MIVFGLLCLIVCVTVLDVSGLVYVVCFDFDLIVSFGLRCFLCDLLRRFVWFGVWMFGFCVFCFDGLLIIGLLDFVVCLWFVVVWFVCSGCLVCCYFCTLFGYLVFILI